MTQFAVFALYLCVSALLLVAFPVMMHPTLSMPRKIILCSVAFFVLVPGALALYAWLGIPQLAIE